MQMKKILMNFICLSQKKVVPILLSLSSPPPEILNSSFLCSLELAKFRFCAV